MFGITSWTDTKGDACPPFFNNSRNLKIRSMIDVRKNDFLLIGSVYRIVLILKGVDLTKVALIITIITHTRLLSHWGRKHCCQFTSVKYGHETQFHNEITSWFIRIRQNWLRGTLTVIFWPPWYSQNYCYNSIKERREKERTNFVLCPRSNHKCHSFFRLLRLDDMRGDIFP